MLSLLAKVLLIYVAAWAAWTLLRSGAKTRSRGAARAKDTPKRFDTSDRDVADAEFEEMRE
jgi:hypothetical protein